MELLTTKIIALTLMGVLSLFFGLLPLRVRKYLNNASKKRERIVSSLLCFGGGVLLATVFTHMLPETRENFASAFEQGILTTGEHYPLTELVTCAGFFLVYFVDEFVHKIFFRRDHHHHRKMTKLAAAIEEENGHTHHHHRHHHHHHHHHPHGHAHALSHAHTNGNSPTDVQPAKCDASLRGKQNPEVERCAVYSITSGGDATRNGGGSDINAKTRWAETGVDNPVFAGDIDAATWNPQLKESILNSTQVMPVSASSGTTTTNAPEAVGHGGHGHGHGHGHSHLGIGKLGAKGLASNLRSLLVILALSFHSVFEGLAIGLQERDMDVWYLFGAICAHKLVIAFCMGLEFLVVGTAVGLMVVYMVVFALVSPLGTAIGIVVTENVSSHDAGHLVAVTILQGLAGGTILYVTFFEVLERERNNGGSRLLKLLFMVLGFGAMAAMEAGGHSHGGGKGHSHGGASAHGGGASDLGFEEVDLHDDPHAHDHHHNHNHIDHNDHHDHDHHDHAH